MSPKHLSADRNALRDYRALELLKNGQSIVVRAITPEDKYILREGMTHLSANSQYQRFFVPKTSLTEQELIYFTEVDFVNHVGLVASVVDGGNEIPAGIARYIVSEDPVDSAGDQRVSLRRAEIAFAVDDQYQGLGIATQLLKHLIKIARADALEEFVALVLPANLKMLAVFEHSGLPMTKVLNVVSVFEITLKLSDNFQPISKLAAD